MQPVHISEISTIADYEMERETLRPRMIALKNRRRIRLGDHLTFLFENHATVRYQIQEMMRIERIVKLRDIAHEVETYNELIPSPGELAASLLIEYETPMERAVKLRELLGLENHIWLDVADERTRATFDGRQIATDRVSSVQYVKFHLNQGQKKNWGNGAALVSDHPCYPAARKLSAAELAELEPDFR
jgi:Protein of unknown function (DUF3501)